MKQAPTTILDLSGLALSHGEGRRLEMAVGLAALELAGQTYSPRPPTPLARLDISRPSGGYALRLRFCVEFEGPCMRCLGEGAVELEVDAREVDQAAASDEELSCPYVEGEMLDLGRWAHDASALAIPTQFLCRADCAGLCPTCGASLNDADPAAHEHGGGADPRWAKLRDLKLG